MDLTLEIIGDGYVILNNGNRWIIQDSIFPYEGATIEEKAQKHIDAILEDMNISPDKTESEKIIDLEERLKSTEDMILQLMMEGMII